MPEISTALQIWRATADACDCHESGIATDASTTAITAAGYPFQSNRTNESNRKYEGAELHWAGDQQSSTLTAALSVSGTSFTVTSGTGFSTSTARPYLVAIDQELILVTFSTPTFTVLERGVAETRAAVHASGATAYGPKFTPNPVGVGAYVATTGVLTPSVTLNIDPGTTGKFDVYTRGVTLELIRKAVNNAVHEMYYEDRLPLTLVADGDMRSSGFANWTAGGSPTVSKVANTNAIEGPRSLRVLATVANDYVQSDSILADPTNRAQQYVRALVRADVGTCTLQAYDVTNSAVIDSLTWTMRGWGILEFSFTLPATCEEYAFRLVSVSSTSDAYWAYVQNLQPGAHEIVAPDWAIRSGQIRNVLMDRSGRNRWDDPNFYPVDFHLVPDPTNPNNQYKIHLDTPISGPLWLDATMPGEMLVADAQTTFLDRTELVAKSAMALCEHMMSGPASAEGLQWRRLYQSKKQAYAKLTLAKPQPAILTGSSRWNY